MIEPTDLHAITPFIPPTRTLMGPGPSDVSARVLAAMARPTIGHLDPAFQRMMEELKTLLRYAFQTENTLTFPVSGPGSVGMEMCFVNLLEPGDTVIVCINGVFGNRMVENVKRCGAIPVIVSDDWGTAVDVAKVAAAFHAHPEARVLAFVHAETSTGAQSDAAALARLAQEHGALTIMDCVTSLGGTPLLLDAWGIDAAYSGSQKCLSCTPGLSPVSFSARAIARVQARKIPVQSWFMDLNLVLGYWGSANRTYHHTAPINPLYGLHEALLILRDEGLEQAWARHRQNHLALKAGLECLGLNFLVREPDRLPQLNTVIVPAGLNEAEARKRLLQNHGLEIGAGLGNLAGKVWRIGLMGHASRRENVEYCLDALECVLSEMGYPVMRGAAVAAAYG